MFLFSFVRRPSLWYWLDRSVFFFYFFFNPRQYVCHFRRASNPMLWVQHSNTCSLVHWFEVTFVSLTRYFVIHSLEWFFFIHLLVLLFFNSIHLSNGFGQRKPEITPKLINLFVYSLFDRYLSVCSNLILGRNSFCNPFQLNAGHFRIISYRNECWNDIQKNNIIWITHTQSKAFEQKVNNCRQYEMVEAGVIRLT